MDINVQNEPHSIFAVSLNSSELQFNAATKPLGVCFHFFQQQAEEGVMRPGEAGQKEAEADEGWLAVR